MTTAEALIEFSEKAEQIIERVESDLNTPHSTDPYFGNGPMILDNVRGWLCKAKDGTLVGYFGDTGFGLSRSDLMFGAVEDSLYDLEQFYRKHLTNAEQE